MTVFAVVIVVNIEVWAVWSDVHDGKKASHMYDGLKITPSLFSFLS